MSLPPKTILVFCDGTGQDGLITDQEPTNKEANHFTNVLRLSRAVTKSFGEGSKKRLQVVYYQSGVGVASDFAGNELASDGAKKAFGTAVASKIRDAYNFIAQNYEKGDQICIFGFSRGAYTARKISGLIDRLGLLSAGEMGRFFTYWKQLNKALPGDPPQPREVVPIKCVGTWDTVGSVYDGVTSKADALTLIDTKLPNCVEIALHAVSFHENRERFLCTLYSGASSGQTLKEVWFPGAHSDVGGGYAERELADISLAWMVGEIKPFVGVDEDFVEKSMSNNPKKPEWGESVPHNPYDKLGLIARGIIGHEDRSSLLTKQAVLHPSLFASPDTKKLLTLSDVKKKLPGWNPEDHICKLSEYEAKIKEFWYDVSRDGEQPQFEDQEEAEGLI